MTATQSKVKILDGMMVEGYIVRATQPVEGEPLSYGVFPTTESAEDWARKMAIPVEVEPVYTPTMNRG